MTTRDAGTRAVVIGAAERPSLPLSISRRLKQAVAVHLLLFSVLLSMPLLLLLAGCEAEAFEERQDG